MAGGKLSPRQKMINLMYLVFIAMLAMNMSKQVLSAFGFMNEKIADSNTIAVKKIEATYSSLELKASEQPDKFGAKHTQAQKVQLASADMFSYIENMKTELTKEVEDVTNYESMDGTDAGDSYFFKGDKYTEQGQEFVNKIGEYRTVFASSLDEEYKGLTENVAVRFDTSDQKLPEEGMQPWLRNRYEGFPLISTITNLTQMQADIKTSETEMLTAMIQGQLESEVSMSNYQPILIPDATATLEGTNFKGRIVLGRYDANLKPHKVIVNGKEVTNFEGGAAMLDMPAGNVGENDLVGEFVFMENGKAVTLEIKAAYAVVAKPNSAVISADKMNVVYRGVQNPITVSMPGIADNALKVNAPGLQKTKGLGKYMMSPGKGREVKINVEGTLPGGQKVTSAQTFRIKDIPAPVAAVRGEYGMIKMPKSTLQKATITSLLPDFVFD